ncbi:hypothetical protein H4W33_000146 [Kibdelosporangium phytohabitans]|nr:hypothetical protein [Kibdelosporangium phytohabitans]
MAHPAADGQSPSDLAHDRLDTHSLSGLRLVLHTHP